MVLPAAVVSSISGVVVALTIVIIVIRKQGIATKIQVHPGSGRDESICNGYGTHLPEVLLMKIESISASTNGSHHHTAIVVGNRAPGVASHAHRRGNHSWDRHFSTTTAASVAAPNQYVGDIDIGIALTRRGEQ
jgi:hypothetical protein